MKVKLLAVDGVPVEQLRKSATPATTGEIAADTLAQAADRAWIEAKRALEREQVVLYSIFHAHGTSRARQLEVSARLDEIEAALATLRPKLSGASKRLAKSDPALRIGQARTRDALGVLLRQPSLAKADLQDPFELSNEFGLRSQQIIKAR